MLGQVEVPTVLMGSVNVLLEHHKVSLKPDRHSVECVPLEHPGDLALLQVEGLPQPVQAHPIALARRSHRLPPEHKDVGGLVRLVNRQVHVDR